MSKRKSLSQKKEPELVDVPPKEKFERLDVTVRDVLSVSNVTVRQKMEAEKRARRPRGRRPKK